MGISPVAVYSEADRSAYHVQMADVAVEIGPAPARESYLRIERILDAAKKTGAEAIHPGYGFLSENAQFSQACEDAGIVFIGPRPRAIREMGDKIVARQTMIAAGVPVVPGMHHPPTGETPGKVAFEEAQKIGFPVMLKATAGGGGKGMRLVHDEKQFLSAYDGASREALSAFGNGTVYLEKYVQNPRHVEVQVLADGHGNAIHLFERDCSVQRRHQKVIEETPCPVLPEKLRREMGQVAVRAAKAVDYLGAGTIEFLYDGKGSFYFLEMNTRLQVEHPITELCSGVDLVRQQILVASGEALSYTQEQIIPRGAAIECRIYAEDPIRFLPSPGTITHLEEPSGPGIRNDSGMHSGATITPFYDPMISKLCAWGETRDLALARMRRALREYVIHGIKTNIPFHKCVLEHPAFLAGTYDTGFIDRYKTELTPTENVDDGLALIIAAYHKARTEASQAQHVQLSFSTETLWRDSARWRRH